jgi:hypothetical protein
LKTRTLFSCQEDILVVENMELSVGNYNILKECNEIKEDILFGMFGNVNQCMLSFDDCRFQKDGTKSWKRSQL